MDSSGVQRVKGQSPDKVSPQNRIHVCVLAKHGEDHEGGPPSSIRDGGDSLLLSVR